ncbi:nuclear transport factor 2 family protein [Flavobacterium sp. IMCC34518]|uniref:nuclear transport factor 2 family protein n=1 Tax=Flavobacterium sp. IMCC34518 TaxID=3003623 RepID=UPI0022AC8A24|nr:nuclear transport factor 2 family protein [Flavobacterium sp. IMCC34518]
MSAKEIVKSFYKSDAFINPTIMKDFLHPDCILDWNSSKGFIQMNYDEILNLTNEISRAYVRTKARISHILEEDNIVSVRFSHYVKTIENPREEMLLAHIMIIWEIKDNKLYKGFQMSQVI